MNEAAIGAFIVAWFLVPLAVVGVCMGWGERADCLCCGARFSPGPWVHIHCENCRGNEPYDQD
jgi:hypothetical protein